MDDKTFDQLEAKDWIKGIESAKNSIRDLDIYPAINNWIKDGKLKNILDVGCGQGICSDKIELTDRTYTGLEPSILMYERAKELYHSNNRRFVNGNIYNLPFADKNFDGVFSILLWHLLSDLEKSTSEISRVLCPGGKFLIITANPDSYEIWKGLYKNFTINGKQLDGTMELPDGTKFKDTLYLHTLDDILISMKNMSLVVESLVPFRQSATGENILISIIGSKLIQ